ncbi:MAG TPA: hypothetical protein VJA46_07035 [Acidimicrobiia bacterium]|nr:hypothetical protein [Acidimicrobiia bacterium]
MALEKAKFIRIGQRDAWRRGLKVTNLLEPTGGVDPWREFDLVILAGVDTYRVAATFDNPAGVTFRVLSETAGRVSWHRIDGAEEDGVVDNEEDGVMDSEWIITPAGVWTLSAGDWVQLDPSDLDAAWALALAPWQLSEPRAVYAQVYSVFADLEPQRWIEVEGREAVVYVGGADTVARFFGEQPGDVVSGQLEVWMDPAGFPLRVITNTTEARDFSIPATLEWSLSDLGAAIEMDLPDEISSATASATPILVWAETDSCSNPDPVSQRCETLIQVYGDGRWEIETTGGDPQSGTIDPSAVEPLRAALDAVDFAQLISLVSDGACSATFWDDQNKIVLFPTLPSSETFASCTLPHDPEQSPYREAFELISQLPID